MKPEEAICILKPMTEEEVLRIYQVEKNAIKLSIEALEWRLELVEEDPDITLEPLPGETEK